MITSSVSPPSPHAANVQTCWDKSPMEAAQLDSATACSVEQVIREMHRAYATLRVKTDVLKGERTYIVSVQGGGQHFCLNKAGEHKRSTVYFTITPRGISQKCHCGRGAGDRCSQFKSVRQPIPVSLQRVLFANAMAASSDDVVASTNNLESAVGADTRTNRSSSQPVADAAAVPQGKKRKKVAVSSEQSQAKLRRFAPPVLGANGRPIVLANIKYSVDLAALREYATSDEAAITKVSSDDPKARRHGLTEREVIERFLRHVVPTASGDGLCTVSYTRSEIGQALVEAGLVNHSRLYPDTYWSCATQLGGKLRSIALGKFTWKWMTRMPSTSSSMPARRARKHNKSSSGLSMTARGKQSCRVITSTPKTAKRISRHFCTGSRTEVRLESGSAPMGSIAPTTLSS